MNRVCSHKISLPLRVALDSRNRSHFTLNLNYYRNTHYFQLNKAKVLFKEQIANQIKNIPFIDECSIEYILFPGSKRECDISNILSIVDKFFCDAMTELGIWKDDNYHIVKQVTYSFGAVDKDNPRAEVIIRPFFKDTNMKISLVQDEIQTAIEQYLANNFNIPSGQICNIEFTAGRGDNGMSASVSFSNKTEKSNNVQEAVAKEEVVSVKSEPETKESVKEVKAEPLVDVNNLFGD